MNCGWESKFEIMLLSLKSPPPPLVLSLNQVSMQVIPLFIFLLNFLLEISRMDGWAGAVNVTRPQ